MSVGIGDGGDVGENSSLDDDGDGVDNADANDAAAAAADADADADDVETGAHRSLCPTRAIPLASSRSSPCSSPSPSSRYCQLGR
eukprot:3256386-Rhodomonas_salina.4